MIHRDDIEAVKLLISDIQMLENRAHRLGMIRSGHALNRAKNAAGWELADEIERIKA